MKAYRITWTRLQETSNRYKSSLAVAQTKKFDKRIWACCHASAGTQHRMSWDVCWIRENSGKILPNSNIAVGRSRFDQNSTAFGRLIIAKELCAQLLSWVAYFTGKTSDSSDLSWEINQNSNDYIFDLSWCLSRRVRFCIITPHRSSMVNMIMVGDLS